MQYYAPLLAHWWVKVPIILFFLLWGAGSLYGIRHLKYGQPLSDLAPDGSYLQDYDSVQRVGGCGPACVAWGGGRDARHAPVLAE